MLTSPYLVYLEGETLLTTNNKEVTLTPCEGQSAVKVVGSAETNERKLNII
jgi:hypothetical protein